MTFLQNRWYAAGFPDEITRQPLARTILDQPLVLYRTESGQAVALGDRCPHRFAPLHLGTVFGQSIRCPYHGLRFGPDGACTDNPLGNGQIPKAARVPAYTVREVDGIVWLWFGDEPADDGRIVRFEVFGQSEEWTTIEGYLPVAAAYTLVSDNLLDLSHAEFLHPDFSTPGFNQRVKLDVFHEGDTVTADNSRPAEPITNAFRALMGTNAPEVVDHRSIVRWHAPATLCTDIGAKPVGAPESDRASTLTAHMITPETENTCHYFWKIARNRHLGSAEFSKRFHAVIMNAFATEDRPMIEAQQRLMAGKSLEELRPVMLPSDTAAGRARQILDKMLAEQAKG
jgi:phenylpropionate dioxygenase-like ring-hydroxylating dioxygenase large terminal subunit